MDSFRKPLSCFYLQSLRIYHKHVLKQNDEVIDQEDKFSPTNMFLCVCFSKAAISDTT